MPIVSFSLFRNRVPVITTTLLRHLSPNRHLVILSANQSPSNPKQNVSKKPYHPNKNLLKAKQTFKDYSSLAPVLSPDEPISLSDSQAIGTVAAAQANFMRVIVQPEQQRTRGGETSSSPVPEGEDSSTRIGVELLCVVRDILKKIKRRVLVGDKVVVKSIDWVDRRGVIENVFQRSSEILDPPVANVSHLLVLFSMEQPPIEPFTLTRFLVEAESYGIPLTLALNKAELVNEQTLIAWKTRLRHWGYRPIFCSVETKHGLDSLAFYLRDQTTVIVGPSGVGKSSLINVLRSNPGPSDALGGENWFDPIMGSKWFEDQRVGEVSTRSGRGKHTTRHVSLLPLAGGGYVADTPGFNQPSLMKVTKQSLAQAFPEIRKILKDSEPVKCSFNDCLHLGEPGCIVKADWERYPYYFQLLDEIRIREEFQLRTFGTKREGGVRYKVGNMGVQQAEPRLEPKKHRRQSRKRINQSILDELDELDDDDSLDFENDLDDDDSLDFENDPIIRAIENENQ